MSAADSAFKNSRLPMLPPPSSGLDIWWVPLPELDYEKLLTGYVDCLSPEELHRLQSRRLPKGQFQFLFTRVALRHLLSAYHPLIAPGEWLVYRSGSGRPYISQAQTPLSFNLTHTHDCLIFAFSQYADPGVDVEKLSRATEFEGIAKRYFSIQEYSEFLELPETERIVFFYRLWTLKEAAVKASGLGLARGLRRFQFSQRQGRDSLTDLIDVTDQEEMRGKFQFWSARFRDHVIAAALVSQPGAILPDISPVSRSLIWPGTISGIDPGWIKSQSRNSSTNLEP
ncbi:MAG: 4'-phosphopantetheinyl transferase superfamily protein [Pseudohongiella sp.]|nr:4'-phosphopantetheinyl transferase superfamily protein [Pseudohongiella sp.]